MFAASVTNARNTRQADRLSAAVTHAIEPLERRVLFAGGDLDALFGVGGTVSLDFFARNDFGTSVAVQGDNKIVVAGTVASGSSSGNDVAVARFNADGTLDTTFGGGDGIVVTDLGTMTDAVVGVAVQADGRIVVGGSTRSSGTSYDVAVLRYNANGSIDTSFGYGGFNGTDVNRTPDVAHAMTMTSDGKIVIVGSTVVAGQVQMMAVRYTAGGMQDIGFGAGGIKIASYPTGVSDALSVRAMADGRIVMAGTLHHDGAMDTDFAAVRLLANGNVDTSFGSNGWARVDLGGADEFAMGLAVMADGRVVLAGSSLRYDTWMNDFAVVRLTAAGQLDESFGAGGMVITDFAGGEDFASAVMVSDGGKVFVAGTATVDGVSRLGVMRLHANGSLDGGWGSHGLASFAAGTSAGANAIAFDANNRVVVAGNTNNGTNSDMLVARLLNPPNMVPVARPGGAYSVVTGGTITLDGSASSDFEGPIASYEWDLNYDGAFNCDCAGSTAVYSASGTHGLRTIALLVTDLDGATHLVTTTVNVLAPPTASAGGPYTVVSGGSVVLDASGSGDADGAIVSYEWDYNYDGSSFDVDATGASPTFSAAGMSAGVRTIAVRVTDGDGLTHVMTTTLTVNAPPPPPPPTPPTNTPAPRSAVLVDDPNHPGRKMLLVTGSSKGDVIRFKTVKGRMEVVLNGKKLGTFSGMTRIEVHGGRGNDVIDARDATVPVMLYGEAGHDMLRGGRFSDVLIGGDGNDHLDGGAGDNVLIGGTGKDLVRGDRGKDLMVGGSLKAGEKRDSVTSLLSAWNRPVSVMSKGSSKVSSKGAAQMSTIASMILDDGAKDTLDGAAGSDLVVTGKGDKVTKGK